MTGIMYKTMGKMLKKLVKTEKGQALPMVLILMVLGGLIIAPLLSHTSSGLIVGTTYEKIADEFYAADAGVEDGLWHINYDHLDDVFTSPAYQRYNYSTEYAYPLSYNLEVNDIDVTVKINNIWIPKDTDTPTHSEAEQLIGEGKLIITGNVSAELTQQVKIYYYEEEGDPELFVSTIGIWLPPGAKYDDEGECTLEIWLDEPGNDYDYTRQSSDHEGGQAIVWTFAEPISFNDLPGVNPMDTPMTYTFTFLFELDDLESERTPEAVSWITTSGVDNIEFTWDADVRVFHINSEAGGENGTIIDAYAIKSELRELGSAINGDYRAIGNTLMVDDNPWSNPPRLDSLLEYSDSIANDIPDNAQVEAAYLYWSAWIEEAGDETLFHDYCTDLDNGNWTYGHNWHESSSYTAFYAHHEGSGGRQLKMANTIDLSSYGPGEVIVSWRNWLWDTNSEGGDCFQYALYNNASSWGDWNTVFCDDTEVGTSPVTFSFAVDNEYLTSDFKIKFKITGFGGTDEYCYIDNIKISLQPETIADISALFKIDGDTVYFTDDEYGQLTVPTIGEGSEEITADEWTVLENEPDEYSYASFKEVTGLVQAFADHGNATYTVGHVDGDTGNEWSYAAWSLIIIYSSLDTKGHQLYLYDDFVYSDTDHNVDFDGDGQPGGTISGFLVPDPIPGEENAAKITCFVAEGDDYYANDFIALNAPDNDPPTSIPNDYKLWDGTLSTEHPGTNTSSNPNNVWNSKSLVISADGIDIDTFYIPWGEDPSDGLLKPGESSAQVDLYTATDSWNLIYILLSFRSRAITGGTVTYLININ